MTDAWAGERKIEKKAGEEMNRIRKIKIVMLSVILISIGMFAGCGSIGGLKDGRSEERRVGKECRL